MSRKMLHALFAALLVFCTPGQAAPDGPKVGVQLWSVKDDVKRDFEATLTRLARMGFDGVEFAGEFGPFGADAAGLRQFLDRAGLQCAGAHIDFEALGDARFAATTAFYKRAGCRFLIIAMDRRAFSVHGAALVAQDLSALSARLAPLGLRIGYHNHAEEMAGADGATPWDRIAQATPDAVILQQDVGWSTFAGKNPAALMRRYPGRGASTHFKAKHAGGAAGINLIGRDLTDWPAVYQAARGAAGAQWIVLEQEDFPPGMAALEAVEASMAGLRAAIARPGRPAAK